jgi:hypothetical protein
MNNDQTLSNDAPMHKYFTMMLNMAEDDLEPFAYRLLAHYIRWTGHGGLFAEGVRTTARRCKMSVTAVKKARETLQGQGYIIVVAPAIKGESTRIIINDRWLENIQRYHTESHTEDSKCVKSDTPPVSNMTHIEEHIEEPKEKDITPPSGDVVWPEDEKPSKGKPSSLIVNDPEILIDDRVPTPKKERPPCKWEPLHDALLEAFGLTAITKQRDKTFWTVAHELYNVKILASQIADLYAYVEKKAKANDWHDWTEMALVKYAPDFIKDGCPKATPARPRLLEPDDPLPPEPVYPGRVERDPYTLPLLPLTDRDRELMAKYGLTEDDVS